MNFVVPGVVVLNPQSGPHFTLPSLGDPSAFDPAVQELYTSIRNYPGQWPTEELQHADRALAQRAEELLDLILQRSRDFRAERRESLEDGEAPLISRELWNLSSRLQNVEQCESEVCRELLHRRGPVGNSQ